MLDPYNTLENAGSPSSAPPQSTSTTADPTENAPTYDSHYRDRRYTPSPTDLANEVLLERHPPLSTITSANLSKSRKTPPPHFSSHLLPAYDASSNNQDENRPLPSPALSNTSATELPPLINANPDFITLDKDLIFPPPPSKALYSLEFAVSATGKSNSLRQSVYRPDGTPNPSVPDKDLYTLSSELSMTSIISGKYIIQGQRRSTFRGMLQLRRTMSLFGKVSWECCPLKDDKGKMDAKQNGKLATSDHGRWKDSRGEALIKTKGIEWLDGSGNVIGREEGGIEMSRKDRRTKEKETKQKKQGQPVEYLPPKLDLVGIARTGEDGGKIRALLIACWVCKCWFWESQTGEKMPAAIKKTRHSYLPILGDAIIHGD